MNLAIVEDLQEAYDNVDLYFKNSPQLLKTKRINLVENLSQRIKFHQNFSKLLDNIADFKGELVLILDLGLDLPLPIKNNLRDTYSISSEIIDTQIDGLVVALEAIKNPKISPLIIVIATKYGHQSAIENFLQNYIDNCDKKDKIKLEFSPRGFGLSNQRHAGEIIEFAISQFEIYFGDRFEEFFHKIESLSHDDCHRPIAKEVLSEFLDLELEQFSFIWQSKEQILRESLKSMGSNSAKPLSAAGAWLYALAAYKCKNPQGNWQSKFNIEDLKADCQNYNLLPPQNLETLRQSISSFYEMCCRLFESSNQIANQETLERVSLSEHQGLRFILNFPCQDVPNSLHERIIGLAKASLNEEELPQQKHKTSLAIWRFWLASSSSDKKPLDEEGIFSPIWRMNVIPQGRKTEVVFYA